jgi:gliding motility-associated lipoprotein GldH
MTKGTGKYILLSGFFFILIFVACNRNVLYTDSVSMPAEEWKLDNVPLFCPEIKDTISANNIFFTLRTGSSYPFRNIYLFVTTTSPSGKSITDTLQYMLADEKGKWHGKGIGDIHELTLLFKSNIYFPTKGIYSFRVRHGMRSETLKSVYDVGIRIEKTKK